MILKLIFIMFLFTKEINILLISMIYLNTHVSYSLGEVIFISNITIYIGLNRLNR